MSFLSLGERPRHWRTSFDEVAQDYDAARPAYPRELTDDIVRLAELPRPARILEIGCGTGQATLPFAERGDHLTCLDIGAAMLAIARRKLAAYPQVTFHQAAFEDWPAPTNAFDLAISATAFHWIEPGVGYPKVASALKPGGSLALFSNEHTGFSPEFADDLYKIDHQIVPSWPDPRVSPDVEGEISAMTASLDELGLFSPATVRTYRWSETYTTAKYLRLLNTYSNYHNLPESVRADLLRATADLIDRRYGGNVTKSYLSILHLVRK